MADHETADNTLADVLWWLRGYAAAKDDARTADLAEQLVNVRNWLFALAGGEKRLLGTNERAFGVALTEHEFEVLVDGVRSDNPSNDRDEALRISKLIVNRLHAEQKKFVDGKRGELPF